VVASVHDGDTFRLSDGTSVRLQGVDANEMDGSCHNECAPMSATASRDYLSRMVLGRRVEIEPTGRSYNRVTAWVSVGGSDVSCALVTAGAAVIWRKYDRTGRLERCR
jgi:endonuclease YncB( thermonuclease family)